MKHLKINTFLLTQLLSMAGITAAAHDIEATNEDGKTIYYIWMNSYHTELAVSYQGSSYYSYSNEHSGNVIIPESVTYNGTTYPVTSIGYQALYECSGLTSVTIPNSVTSIGNLAFCDCSGLKMSIAMQKMFRQQMLMPLIIPPFHRQPCMCLLHL